MNEPYHATSRAWSWRHAVGKSGLPPMTRLVLHTLGLKMDATGGSCFPPVSELVDLTGLDKKTVLKHLDVAREAGWIEISKHGFAGQRWKRNEYIARWPGRDVAGQAHSADGEGGGAVPPPSEGEKVVEMVPEGGGNGAPKVVEQFHQDKILPSNIPENSPEREGAGAKAAEGKRVESRADLIKRVQRFCVGIGYERGEWRGWNSATIDYIARQFAGLDPQDQDNACAWRDRFLAKCERDGVKIPMPVGNYFRDRAWQVLEMLADAAGAAGGEATGQRVEKIPAPPFGPLFGAVRAWHCLRGPDESEVPLDVRDAVIRHYRAIERNPALAARYLGRKGITISDANELIFPHGFDADERRLRLSETGFPAVNALHEKAKIFQAAAVEARFLPLKDLCEPVKIDSVLFAQWLAHDEHEGWPRLPDPGRLDVVWLPRGGPAGLADFEAAARAVLDSAEARGDGHAA